MPWKGSSGTGACACRCRSRAATLQLPALQAWARVQLATLAVRRQPLSGSRLLTAPAARTGAVTFPALLCLPVVGHCGSWPPLLCIVSPCQASACSPHLLLTHICSAVATWSGLMLRGTCAAKHKTWPQPEMQAFGGSLQSCLCSQHQGGEVQQPECE